MQLFAVFGNPIQNSLSPQIHQAFAKQAGIELGYEKIEANVQQFPDLLKAFFTRGGIGANVTVPLKLKAFDLCAKTSAQALRAKAVNVISNHQGSLWGDNTDGKGLCLDLMNNHGLDLQDKRLLILGAGGVVQGILGPLLDLNPQSIVIANRTPSKAQQLAEIDPRIQATTLAGINSNESYDIVINATGRLPSIPQPCINQAIVIDLSYSAQQLTPFLQWAQSHGAGQIIDGIGMLVEQAALSFELWHGFKPSTRSVIDDLRQN